MSASNIWTDISMNNKAIVDCTLLRFNNSNNLITDNDNDLKIAGNNGMLLYLKYQSNPDLRGGIIFSQCSTVRPSEIGDTRGIELGASTSSWKNVYADRYTLNGSTITEWPSGGTWINSATSTLNMNNFAIYNTSYVTSNSALVLIGNQNVFLRSNLKRVYIEAADEISLKWNKKSTTYEIRFDNYKIYPYSHDCEIDLGDEDHGWDRIFASDIYASTHSSFCDLAELQFTDSDINPGDIVELTDWKGEEKKYFDKAKKECKEKKCKTIKYFGYQGRWTKAKKKSTKCPSVISTQPAHSMGEDKLRRELYKQGKMNFIALSGSIPNVFIEGEFKSGDIIVSAGEGKAMVDNDCKWNQAIGYTKSSGKNERCEIWIR